MNSFLRVFVVLFVTLAVCQRALGAACATGDAPTAYASSACNAGSAYDICQRSTDLVEIDCRVDINGSATGGEVYAVYNYGSSAHTFSFWGTDSGAGMFCCVFDEGGTEVSQVALFGSDYGDVLAFQNPIGSEYMDDPGGKEILVLFANGGDGEDRIDGTPAVDSSMNQLFYGEGAKDVISARALPSFIFGGLDSDSIVGSPEDDDIFGDYNGGAAGSGDHVSARSGHDEIHGGPGNDDVCGEFGGDVLYGDGGDDLLYGGAQTDQAYGGADYDLCDAETLGACDGTLTSRPTDCP